LGGQTDFKTAKGKKKRGSKLHKREPVTWRKKGNRFPSKKRRKNFRATKDKGPKTHLGTDSAEKKKFRGGYGRVVCRPLGGSQHHLMLKRGRGK